jgi:hypothetical protein
MLTQEQRQSPRSGNNLQDLQDFAKRSEQENCEAGEKNA